MYLVLSLTGIGAYQNVKAIAAEMVKMLVCGVIHKTADTSSWPVKGDGSESTIDTIGAIVGSDDGSDDDTAEGASLGEILGPALSVRTGAAVASLRKLMESPNVARLGAGETVGAMDVVGGGVTKEDGVAEGISV